MPITGCLIIKKVNRSTTDKQTYPHTQLDFNHYSRKRKVDFHREFRALATIIDG